MENKLYFYRSHAEFKKYSEEQNKVIIPFMFTKTKETMLKSNGIIDITSSIALVDSNRAYMYDFLQNFEDVTENTKIIISEEWAQKALEFFPTLFLNIESIFKNKIKTEKSSLGYKNILYFYDENQYESIKEHCANNNKLFITFAAITKIDYFQKEVLIDISSLIESIKGAPNLIYYFEQFIVDSNIKKYITVDRKKLDDVKNIFKFSFDEYKDINYLINEISKSEVQVELNERNYKITNIAEDKLGKLYSNINEKLIGHEKFKSKLIEKLKYFIKLNKLNKTKIFPIFLLGKPGLGKTEIGKIISKSINEDSRIIKINFGNYTSKDSLNSLIGSPAGYIGCEGGELSQKISSNKTGVIICDEFEKADSKIKNFFLELLEDGRFTDSMGREYDLEGYIIIFTSNLLNKQQLNECMSPEFISRINLICEFNALSLKDKEKYVEFLKKEFISELNNEDKLKIKRINLNNFNLDSIDDLREIKEKIYSKIIINI